MSKQKGEWASPPSDPLSSGNPGTIPTFTTVSSHTLSISAVMINSVCLPSDDFELPRDVPSPRRFLNFSFSPESLLWGFAIADKQAVLSPCKYRMGFLLREAQGESLSSKTPVTAVTTWLLQTALVSQTISNRGEAQRWGRNSEEPAHMRSAHRSCLQHPHPAAIQGMGTSGLPFSGSSECPAPPQPGAQSNHHFKTAELIFEV